MNWLPRPTPTALDARCACTRKVTSPAVAFVSQARLTAPPPSRAAPVGSTSRCVTAAPAAMAARRQLPRQLQGSEHRAGLMVRAAAAGRAGHGQRRAHRPPVRRPRPRRTAAGRAGRRSAPESTSWREYAYRGCGERSRRRRLGGRRSPESAPLRAAAWRAGAATRGGYRSRGGTATHRTSRRERGRPPDLVSASPRPSSRAAATPGGGAGSLVGSWDAGAYTHIHRRYARRRCRRRRRRRRRRANRVRGGALGRPRRRVRQQACVPPAPSRTCTGAPSATCTSDHLARAWHPALPQAHRRRRHRRRVQRAADR